MRKAQKKVKRRSVKAPPARLEITYVPISELLPYKNNPRKHDHAIDKFGKGLEEFGVRYPILVNKRDKVVIDGHLRVKSAAKLGYKEFPVIFVDDWTPEQIKAFRMWVNKSAGFANWDPELLALEMEQLDSTLLDSTGFDPIEIEELKTSQELTDLRAKINTSGHKRSLGDRDKQIKLVLYLEEVRVVEEALRATGEANRGKAIQIICEAYLGREEETFGAKRQKGWDGIGLSLQGDLT